jgi:hypothetical protein
MCSCGQTFGVSALDVAAGPQQLRERAAVAELDAVGVDVLPEQRHLQDAVGGERLHLGEHVTGPAVLLLTAQGRDNAERAGVVAAHRDRHPARVGGLAARGQRGGEHLERLGDLHLGRGVVAGPLQQHGQRVHVVRAEDDVHPGRLPHDRLAVLLREASPDRDLHTGPRGLDRPQVTEIAVEPVVGVLPDRAGVEHDDVGVLGARLLVPRGLEQPSHPLGVVHVHLTPVGADRVAAGHGFQG